MTRTLLALVIGALGGAAAMALFAPGERSARSPETQAAAQARPAARVPEQRPATPAPKPERTTTSERAETYRVAIDADRRELDRLVANVAAQPPSAARDFKLDVLLQRYTEVAPRDAIAAARAIGSPTTRIAELYGAWAAADAPHALAALDRITDVAEARSVGIAVLAALGNDEAALDQVLGALPAAKETDLRVAAVTALAESAPDQALDAALRADDDNVRRLSLQRVATAWARSNVHAALAAADAIADTEPQRAFRAAVVAEWARLDAEAVLDYVVDLPRETQQEFLAAGLREVASASPRRALAIADRFPPGLREQVRMVAMQSFGVADPLGAVKYAESLPPGDQRTQLLTVAAQGYARKDPDAALAWAKGRVPPQPNLIAQVLAGIARKDANRAIDEALALPLQQDRTMALQLVTMNASQPGGSDPAAVADRVFSFDDRQQREVPMQMFFSMWGARAPVDAVDWLLANAERAPAYAFASVAERFGSSDPARAATFTSRMPEDARPAWIRGVATGYAKQDPRAALSWIEQFRGTPAYDDGIGAVVQGLASVDPRAAAELLATAPSSKADGAAFAIAAAWAQKEPAAAADWALELPSGQVREGALRQITDAWANQDPAGARSWVMRLPAGSARDVPLTQLLSVSGRRESPDPALFNAFSSAAARERGIAQAIWGIAARDPAEARELGARYVTDPALRQQVEQTIQQVGQGNVRVFPSGGGQSIVEFRN